MKRMCFGGSRDGTVFNGPGNVIRMAVRRAYGNPGPNFIEYRAEVLIFDPFGPRIQILVHGDLPTPGEVIERLAHAGLLPP